MNVSFKAGEYTRKTEEIISEICETFENNGKTAEADALRNYKKQIDEKERIRIAFIGQWSSGKSSIISALTENNQIKISSDVATQESTDYEWGDFLLTDTPGLHNNDDHDEKAANAIKTADLIVYCITSELFTPNTLADFKNLAFEKNYLSKMILVINKLGMEACESRDELIANYTKSLNESLEPHSLDEINHCFTDVDDYKKGKVKDKRSRIEKSRFEIFIELLNNFIKEKGLMCRLLTPVHTAEEILNGALISEAETPLEEAERTVLSKAETAIKNIRRKADNEWNRVLIENSLIFSGKAYNLLDSVMQDDGVNAETEMEKIIHDTYTAITEDLENCIETARESIKLEMKNIEDTPQAQFYLRELKKELNPGIEGVDSKKSSGVFNKVFSSAKDVIKDKAADVSQESIKNVITKVADKVNKKFKPWGKIKLAQKIGDALKFVGPALDVLELGMNVYETISENKQANKVLESRRQQRKAIEDAARGIRDDFNEQKAEFIETEFNSKIEMLHELEAENIKRKTDINDFNKKIREFKIRLEELNKEILSET